SVQPKTMVCLFTSVRVGVEKPRMKFARGDLAFLPSGALICIFTREVQSDAPLNPLGRVEEGEDIFDRVRSGDVVRLSLVP
ncbi:MAG TPA: cyclophilin-like family protein, partial [Nitrososphaerales archaeon]|nr:cyclophilin-like family protein [Nitrososphaerales archaeon]